MILVLIAILISALTSWVLLTTCTDGFLSFVATCMLFLVFIASIGYTFTAWEWLGSKHKANVINEQFGTNYSREEVFWSSDVIYLIHKLKKEQVNE